jgi:uncharacterized repeat protein (TIGR03843 family)
MTREHPRAGLGGGGQQRPHGSHGADPADALRAGELQLVGRLAAASNATFLCTAQADGRSVRCIYKPVRGERPLWDFPDGTLARREVASYLVAEAFGGGLVPETVLRDGPFGVGMVQQWIFTASNHLPGEKPRGDEPEESLVDVLAPRDVPPGWLPVLRAMDEDGRPLILAHADDPRLLRLAALDVLLNNADRKGGHILVGLDGRVYGVDHGICLHTEDKLRTVLWGWAGKPLPAELTADIARLRAELDGVLADQLADLLSPGEVHALRRRADELLEAEAMPRPYGSRTIPWPPF